MFSQMTNAFGAAKVDMFASRMNKQLSRSVSWKPDTETEAVDAFALD